MHNDFFKELRKDHEELKGILKKLKNAGDGATKQREELFAELKKELLPHQEAEEHVFYPALMEKKEVREDTLESIEEHHVAELVLKELDKMPKGEEQWKAKMSVLKELIEHHIEEEESKIFKDADKVLSHEQMDSILKKFQEDKEKIKSKM